jgi:hypothetical protein
MTLLLLLVFIAAPALAQDHQIEKLSWMSGCWVVNRGNTLIEEHWSKPAGGSLLGFSRTIKGGRTVFHEFLRIEQAEGGIRYVARIGAKEVPFALAKQSDGEAEFTNPAHDFPQVIRYRRLSADEIHARVDGPATGKERAQDFPMKRAACQ